MLNLFNPTLIVLNAMPDQVFTNFHQITPYQVKLENHKFVRKFDQREWIDKISLSDGKLLIPDTEVETRVFHKLIREGKIKELVDLQAQDTPRGRKYQRKQDRSQKTVQPASLMSQGLQVIKHRGRLNLELLTTIGLWHRMQNNKLIPILLGDIPELIKTQNLINSFSLLQMKDMLEICSFELGQNLDISPRSALGAAFHKYPEIFLNQTDEYMSALLRAIVENKDQSNQQSQIYNRVMVFTGYGQCQSLPQFLFRSAKSLQECVKVKPKFQTLVCDDDPGLQIDKLAIVQVMRESESEIVQKLSLHTQSPRHFFSEVQVSQQHKLLIKYYSQDLGSQAADNYELSLHLYKELCHKYRGVVEQKVKEGKRSLEKMFHLHMLKTENF